MKIRLIKILILIQIILLFGYVCYAAEEFRTAIEKSLKINQNRGQFTYLHFTFNFIPEFYDNILTDLRYEILYNEVGTNYQKTWVDRTDGHLININGLGVNDQWKGPFAGLRPLRYKFRFELADDIDSTTGKAIFFQIFSTNPEIDARYFNSFYNSPFTVKAFYYDFSGVRVTLNSYSHLSTIYAVYKITQVSNPLTIATTAILENILIFVVDSHLEDLESKPITIDLTCNACGAKYSLKKNNLNDFTYSCKTRECQRSVVIKFN